MEKKNIFILVIVIAIFVVGGIVAQKNLPQNKGSLATQEVGDKVMKFLQDNIPGLNVSLINVVEESGLFKVTLNVEGQERPVYVSQDGKLFFPQVVDLEQASAANDSQANSGEVVKRDIPDVKLFVMSYCPFGLQAQKALLPVWELLGDKADFGIYFVNYAMHDKIEIDENVRQYCIQKEQQDKFVAYLKCFVKAGDAAACLTEAGIDQTKLSTCQAATDEQFKVTENYNDKSSWLNGTYPKFMIDADLNDKYGVSGSPTLVINDKVVEVSDRSPESFKKVICDAFTSAPQACSQQLSTEAAAAGFGEGTGSSSGGSCN